VLVGKTRAVQRDADTRREDRIHEASRVPDQHEAVACKLLHGIAVVALVLERPDALGLLQRLGDQRTASHRIPEELLAIGLRFCEILLLRDHTQAGDGIGDGNLPDPRVRNWQEVDVDVVQVRVAHREYLAIVAIEPGMNGVLVEYLILYLQLELVSKEGLASAAIDHHLAADIEFLVADAVIDL